MSARDVMMEADIGGVKVSFAANVEGDELDAWLDQHRKAVNRQKAQHELVEALVDLVAFRDAIDTYAERRAKLQKDRAADRARTIASLEAAHVAANRRGNFELSAQNRQALHQHDLQTQAELDKLEADNEGFKAKLPSMEARVKRSEDLVAGLDKADIMREMLVPKKMAAE